MKDIKEQLIKLDKNVIEFREGAAAPHPEETGVRITGILKAPKQYLTNKVGVEKEEARVWRMQHSNGQVSQFLEPMYNYKQAILKVNTIEKNIQLVLNSKSRIIDVIEGNLKKHEVWSMLKVNTDISWSPKQLRQILKRLKFYFEDKTEHSKTLEKLFNFHAKIEKEIVDKNVHGSYDKSTKLALMNDSGMAPYFKIKAPVYAGYETKVINVELVADVSDGDVKYLLESQDLFILEEQLWEKYLDEELKFFEENDISVVKIS